MKDRTVAVTVWFVILLVAVALLADMSAKAYEHQPPDFRTNAANSPLEDEMAQEVWEYWQYEDLKGLDPWGDSKSRAMDIVAGARQVYVAMTHKDKLSQSKIVPHCTYPLTGKAVVKKIFTDLAVISVNVKGLFLEELAPGVTLDEVLDSTKATLHVHPKLQCQYDAPLTGRPVVRFSDTPVSK